jgi:hypothetical protein
MMNICKSYDKKIFSKFIKNEEGYYNERMKFEADKRKKYSDSRSENRVKGLKHNNKKHKNISLSYDNHMENENENINEDIIDNKIKVQFENFRKLYPGTKRGLDIEFENFRKKHKDYKKVSEILNSSLNKQLDARMQKKKLGGFIPEWKNLQTYINQRCWEEEIPITADTQRSDMDDLKEKLKKLQSA